MIRYGCAEDTAPLAGEGGRCTLQGPLSLAAAVRSGTCLSGIAVEVFEIIVIRLRDIGRICPKQTGTSVSRKASGNMFSGQNTKVESTAPSQLPLGGLAGFTVVFEIRDKFVHQQLCGSQLGRMVNDTEVGQRTYHTLCCERLAVVPGIPSCIVKIGTDV